ncbi:MAG: aminoacyl-tRNA hydrolase [Schleiferiaceae bacterium]|nr:aminoacyl-tRNA hydrolase [Schleiferiaceae bacterium]
MKKYLIVGLGNIGADYAHTRHNIGFDVLDAFAKASNIFFAPDRYADVATTSLKGRKITLIKPSTYMNLSGKAVRYWAEQLQVPQENILVIVDEIALPFGTLRLKLNGSHGGHNGLKNIQDLLNTTVYPRLRFGIGNDYPKGQQVDYVLGHWSDDQQSELPELLNRAVAAIESFVLAGPQITMNTFNTKK